MSEESEPLDEIIFSLGIDHACFASPIPCVEPQEDERIVISRFDAYTLTNNRIYGIYYFSKQAPLDCTAEDVDLIVRALLDSAAEMLGDAVGGVLKIAVYAGGNHCCVLGPNTVALLAAQNLELVVDVYPWIE
jgi:hypothetical protein